MWDGHTVTELPRVAAEYAHQPLSTAMLRSSFETAGVGGFAPDTTRRFSDGASSLVYPTIDSEHVVKFIPLRTSLRHYLSRSDFGMIVMRRVRSIQPPPSDEEREAALIQLCTHGIFHGDAHDDNFLRDADNTVFAIDFGYAGLFAPSTREIIEDCIAEELEDSEMEKVSPFSGMDSVLHEAKVQRLAARVGLAPPVVAVARIRIDRPAYVPIAKNFTDPERAVLLALCRRSDWPSVPAPLGDPRNDEGARFSYDADDGAGLWVHDWDGNEHWYSMAKLTTRRADIAVNRYGDATFNIKRGDVSVWLPQVQRQRRRAVPTINYDAARAGLEAAFTRVRRIRRPSDRRGAAD